VELGPLLRAHGFLQVERPPELWDVDADDELLIRMLGEMIAAALVRGTELGDVVLRADNVTATEADDALPVGDYVALSIEGSGDWAPEVVWRPDDPFAPVLVGADLDAAARAAGVPWAYTGAFATDGSVTVLLPRLHG
jgi:hypothetical protein